MPAWSRRSSSIRGGTDGSRLTELGLPTPNLSTGEHNPHSPLEWTCLEEMETAVKVLIELAQVWARNLVPTFGNETREICMLRKPVVLITGASGEIGHGLIDRPRPP